MRSPLVAGVALPFHYGLEFPVALYMFWMIVSVFWQDYLTFGLLQKYLAERFPTWAVLVASAVIFWAGNALFLPDKFAPVHVLPTLRSRPRLRARLAPCLAGHAAPDPRPAPRVLLHLCVDAADVHK
ncbi:MAG: hypothetical protein R2722_15180 [Tessaracoccus sp.]